MKKIFILLLILPTLLMAQVSPTGFEAYEHPIPDFTPNAPQNLVATAGVGSVSLTWDIPIDIYGNSDTDISSYTIQRKTGIGGVYSTLTTTLTNSYTDQSVVTSTAYYYKVSATDINNQTGSYSSESNATPLTDSTPPTTPGSFVATANGTSITINWVASTDIGGSGVENYSGDRSLSSDFSSPTSFTTTGLSFAHSNLATSTTYYYRVRAKDYSGNYSSYATAQATTAEPTSDPIISNVTGTIANGNLITITGSGFGTRIATQQIYDNMEGSTFNPAWSSTGSQSSSGERMILVSAGSNARHQFSLKNTSANFVGTNNIGHASFAGGSNDTQWFCQYWFKLDTDWTWGTGLEQSVTPYNLSNIKIFRLWSTGSSPEDFAIATEGWTNRILVTGENITPSQASYPSINDGYQTQQRWSIGSWHCMQFEFKENSALSVADGVARWWIDGELLYASTTRITRQNSSETKRPYGLGFYNTSGDTRTDPNHVYFDDVFMANSLARVEIGNNPTYGACTYRELQPTYIFWTSGQIQFQLNQGSFTTGQQAYVFVVNSNGASGTNVSIGYPITIQ